MYKFLSDVSKEEYDNFVSTYSMASFMQDYAWGDVKDNWQSFKCGVSDNDKLVGVALVLCKDIFNGHNVFYIPRGYLIDFTNKEALKVMTEGIKKLAEENKAFLVKLDPNFCVSDELASGNFEVSHNFTEDNQTKHQNMLECGYKYNGLRLKIHDNFQPQCNMVVPLINNDNRIVSLDELKGRYKSKFKYYLEPYLSNRGVTFEVTDNLDTLPEFVKLLNFTEDRNNIKLRDIEYFKKILTAFKGKSFIIYGNVNLNKYLSFLEANNDGGKDDDEIARVKYLLKESNTLRLSTGLVIMPINKDGIRTSEYLYAGNNLVLRKLSISLGLVFEILKISIENGCHYCNLGGVDGDQDDSLSIFKSKFLPQLFIFTGEYDLVLDEDIYSDYIK